MFSFLSGKSKIKEALRDGAIIIDVRTPHEFDMGRVPDSMNIPVDRIATSIERIKTINGPIIVCCNSGARSAQAMNILKEAGIKNIVNGGNWETVLKIKNRL